MTPRNALRRSAIGTQGDARPGCRHDVLGRVLGQQGKVEIRLGVATSSVLTLIANRFVFATLLPHLPYMTRMDYLSVGSTLLVLLSLFMVVLCGYLETRQKHLLTSALNLWSRGVFPGAFMILLAWFLFG